MSHPCGRASDARWRFSDYLESSRTVPRHRKVCCRDNRTQYSAVPLGVLVTITLRRRVNARTACSAETVDVMKVLGIFLVSQSSLLSAFSSITTQSLQVPTWSGPIPSFDCASAVH